MLRAGSQPPHHCLHQSLQNGRRQVDQSLQLLYPHSSRKMLPCPRRTSPRSRTSLPSLRHPKQQSDSQSQSASPVNPVAAGKHPPEAENPERSDQSAGQADWHSAHSVRGVRLAAVQAHWDRGKVEQAGWRETAEWLQEEGRFEWTLEDIAVFQGKIIVSDCGVRQEAIALEPGTGVEEAGKRRPRLQLRLHPKWLPGSSPRHHLKTDPGTEKAAYLQVQGVLARLGRASEQLNQPITQKLHQ